MDWSAAISGGVGGCGGVLLAYALVWSVTWCHVRVRRRRREAEARTWPRRTVHADGSVTFQETAASAPKVERPAPSGAAAYLADMASLDAEYARSDQPGPWMYPLTGGPPSRATCPPRAAGPGGLQGGGPPAQ